MIFEYWSLDCSSSAPIFDSSGKYQGMIGGTIYLEENNIWVGKTF